MDVVTSLLSLALEGLVPGPESFPRNAAKCRVAKPCIQELGTVG